MGRQKHGNIAIVFALVVALMALAFTGCASSENQKESDSANAATTQEIVDLTGRTVEVPTEPEAVIGIGASSLRAISYLGAKDLVVGVEGLEMKDAVTCTYRHAFYDTFSKLPVIGEGGSKGTFPNEEAIIAAKPDVIIASLDKDSADALQSKTGIPVVCVKVADNVFDDTFYKSLELIGDILNKEDRADEVINYTKDIQNDLLERTKDVTPKTAYAAGISFRGGHGFAGTQADFPPFKSTNVINIVDGLGSDGCFDVDLEKVANDQPELIFIESGNYDLVREDVVSNPGYFENLKAVQDGNVYSLVSYRYYATNVDLALANCYQVGCVAYPEQFADIDPTKKLDEITTFFLGVPLSEDLAAEGYSFKQYDLLND